MVTKIYYFLVCFEPGNAAVTDCLSIDSMRQAVWRAQIIPRHRIEIEAHEDLEDMRDAGMAMRRLEALRDYLLVNSIPEERLEMRVRSGKFWVPRTGEFARIGAIRLFPRVASLRSGVGEPLLSCAEVCLLQRARELVVFAKDRELGEFVKRFGQIDWTRIVGYPSLRQWVSKGARHPLYGRR